MANDTKTIEILPEDRVILTNDQQNLIELALAKQVPPEDAEFMEKIEKTSQNALKSFTEIKSYFVTKYGVDFGIIYLTALTHGEEGYTHLIKRLEQAKAERRIKKQKLN